MRQSFDLKRIHRLAQARGIVGRDDLIATLCALLCDGQSVVLLGAPNVGKSVLASLFCEPGLTIIDPFVHVTPHLAADLRRGLERARCYLVVTHTLDRHVLGAVRRIMFWFTTLRVPPLSRHAMRRILDAQFAGHRDLPPVPPSWTREVLRRAAGRPGEAIAVAQTAMRMQARTGRWPSTAAAIVETSMRRSPLSSVRDFAESSARETVRLQVHAEVRA